MGAAAALAVLLVVSAISLVPDDGRPSDGVGDPSSHATPPAQSPPPPTSRSNVDAAEPGGEVIELVVDGTSSSASDDNDGTPGQPLATIGEAAARADGANRSGDSVHVRIRAGTYRESVDLTPSTTATDAELVVEGEGEVIVSGSDPFTDWQEVGEGIYHHVWDRDWGEGDVPDSWLEGYGGQQLADNPVIRRREMVFVDGQLLTPHTTARRMRDEPGSFHVDEDADRLLIHVPDGVDPGTVDVEVATRDTLLKVGQRRNVRIENLVLQHAASPPQGKALVIVNSDDVVVEDVVLQWNSWAGLAISQSTNVTVRDTVANNNGVGGMTGFEASDVLVEDSETSHNNWRGIRGAEHVEPGAPVDSTFVDYAAGQKFLFMRRTTFRRHTAVGNQASGLWFDFDNRDIVIEDSTFRDNLTWGVFMEASPGPLRLDGVRACGNEVGIHIANSADGTVIDSVFDDNRLGHLHLGGRESRSVTDAVSGDRYDVTSEGWSIMGNTFGTTAGAVAIGATVDAATWRRFVDSLLSDDNLFVGSTAAIVATRDREMSLDQWRQETGQDGGSSGRSDGAIECERVDADV